MVKEFLKLWDKNKDWLYDYLDDCNTDNLTYTDLMQAIISTIFNPEYHYNILYASTPNNYQGELLFIIGNPDNDCTTRYYTTVFYGSCSYCDALEGALSNTDHNTKIRDLMSLCLHLFQRLTPINATDTLDNDWHLSYGINNPTTNQLASIIDDAMTHNLTVKFEKGKIYYKN